jgi:hypothetical protein
MAYRDDRIEVRYAIADGTSKGDGFCTHTGSPDVGWHTHARENTSIRGSECGTNHMRSAPLVRIKGVFRGPFRSFD